MEIVERHGDPDLGHLPCHPTMATLGHRSVSLPQLQPWIRGVEHEERGSEAVRDAQCGEPGDVPERLHSNRPDDQQGQPQQRQVQQQEEEVQQERQQREEQQQQQQQQSVSAVLGPRSVAVSLTVDHAFGFASPATLPPAVLSALAALADSAHHQAAGCSAHTAERTADGALPPALEGILRNAPPAGPGDTISVDGSAVAERYGQWSGESGSYSLLLPAAAPAAVTATTVSASDSASPPEAQELAATAASETAASTGAGAAAAAAVAVDAQAASVETLQGAPAGKASSWGLASDAPAAVPSVVTAEGDAAAGEGEEGAEAALLAVEVRWKGARAGLMGSMFGRAVKRGCSSAQPPRGPHGMVRWEEGFAHDCHLLPCPAALRAARGQGEPCGKGCLFQPWEVVLLVHKHAPSRPRERAQQVASVVLDVAPLASPLSTQPLTHHLLLLFAPPDSPPVGLLQRRSRESKSPALPLGAAGRAGEGEGQGAAGSGSAEQSSGGGQQEEADWVQGADGDTEWEQVERRASDGEGEEGESGLGGQGMEGQQASSADGMEAVSGGGGGDGQRGVELSAGNTRRQTSGAMEQQGENGGAVVEGEGESLAGNRGPSCNGDVSGGADTGAGASTVWEKAGEDAERGEGGEAESECEEGEEEMVAAEALCYGPLAESFLLPPFLPAKPLAATSAGSGGGGGGGAGVGAFLRRPLLFLRTLSLQERGEPLLHKAYGEEGGDEIDWDRRKALEAEQEHPLYKLPLEEQQAASAGEAEAGAVSPSASSVRELFGDEFRVGQWERREVVSRDGTAQLCAPVFLATVDQCHASAAGEGACALLVAHIAAWVHAHGEGTLPGQAELDDLIRAGSADWRRLRALSDFHQRFPDGHFDLDTVLAAVQHSHSHSDAPPHVHTDHGGQAVGAEANSQAPDKDGGGNTDPGAPHSGSSSGGSHNGGEAAGMPRLPLCVVPSQSFVGFFHPPCLAARRAKEDAARTQGSSTAEGDAADVNRGEVGVSTVDESGRDTDEGDKGKDEEVVEKSTRSSPDVEAKGNGAEASLERGKQEQASCLECAEDAGEKSVGEKGMEDKGMEQLAFLEGMLSFDDIWEAVVQAGEGVYIMAWNDHFFLLLLRRPQPRQHQPHHQQHGRAAVQAALDGAAGKHTGEGRDVAHGGTGGEVSGGEVECVVIDTLGERLHEGCSQAFMLLFDSSSWVDVGLPPPAAPGSTVVGGAGAAGGGGGEGGAGDGGGGQAKVQGTGDSSEQGGRADEAERAEGRAGGVGAQVPKVETGKRWGVKAGKGSGKSKDGSGKGKGSSGVNTGAGGVGSHPHGVNDTVRCEVDVAKGVDVKEGTAQGTHVAEVEEVVPQARQLNECITLLPADTHGMPTAITVTSTHVDSPSADTCSPPCGDESASTAADSVLPTAVHAAEATCLLTHTDGPAQSPIHETKASTTNFDGCASTKQPTQTVSCAAGSSRACTATASPPTSAAPACGGEGEGDAAPVTAGRRVWGAEACREYLKAFLAAVPLAEVESDLRKGLLASPEAIHRRLQVELHFTRLL
ncbi:unnamed protein product [Closterium sp. Yama58-4]|nr:unnamed protein product [Closterium sp. Yama58-4]